MDASVITLLSQQERSGTVASAIVAVPTGAASIVLRAVMADADTGTPGNVVGLCVIWSFDLYQPAHAGSCVWQSGYYAIPGGGGYGHGPPGLAMAIPSSVVGFAGQLVLPHSLSIGLQMDILDANGNTLLSTAPPGAGMTVDVPVYPVLQT